MSSAVSGGRVRKNSIAGGNLNGLNPMHPSARRNTISHLDLSSFGMGQFNSPMNRLNALGINAPTMGMAGLPGPTNFDYRGMSTTMGNHSINGLPKLNTQSINNIDMSNSLRTAPPQGSFGGFDIDQLFSPGTTVNPAQLHFGGGSNPVPQPNFPALEPFTVHSAIDPQAQSDDFGWMRNWNMQMSHDNHENAIDDSSPSRISSGDSPGDITDSMNNSNANIGMSNNFQWHQQDAQMPPLQQVSSAGPFALDALNTGLPNLEPPPGTISPNTLHDPTPTADAYFPPELVQQHQQQQHQQMQMQMQQDMKQNQPQNFFASPMSNFSSDSPSMTASSMTGSARQSSVTSMSTDSITDATRHALLMSLAQPTAFGMNHRKYSQRSISSPLSPSNGRGSVQGHSLPSTTDIRRYVDAFIQFAHPHLPVFHIPTLNFDSIEYSSGLKPSTPHFGSGPGISGGGGCLILSMAAIGALYEYDHPASKELFDASKKMISLYLEERRKADMSAAVNGGAEPAYVTPLWLVQTMLLNVVYGHQCGDKTSADIASNQCAALVSLARAANLNAGIHGSSPGSHDGDVKTEAHDDSLEMDLSYTISPSESVSRHQSAETDLQSQWLNWKVDEERKRTLFAIFIISSTLTAAYNHTPTITNSEIGLDLPCEEALYAADSAQEWQNRGGFAAAEQNAVSFGVALRTLLTANQRQGSNVSAGTYGSNGLALQSGNGLAESELRPSTFGCLVLINALHNYIWETRSRHCGRQWTPQETETMFSHIEPALNAWQAAWKANEHHKLERPNPFGLGPLAADSIPLLDLAFVRLFVNLGRSKEAFWQRDFDGMADELARGSEIVQHAGSSPGDQETNDVPSGSGRRASQVQPSEQSSSRRERHLRKAAFYAADSLTFACTYNLTYADIVAHELPVQSAMCFFDCSQVLAEWACTVQERVGRYLGILGRDHIDFTQVPAIMLLESEDVDLLRKIERICESLESKRFQQENMLAVDLGNVNSAAMGGMANNANLGACGYGSKILRITGMMLEKAVVWPGKLTVLPRNSEQHTDCRLQSPTSWPKPSKHKPATWTSAPTARRCINFAVTDTFSGPLPDTVGLFLLINNHDHTCTACL